jgi:hypothetical protein
VTVAALYVEKGGAYWNLPGVDPWDEERDARLYDGPHPVVAHPPCARWSVPLAFVNQTRYGYMVGDDGGCFESALRSVRAYGGVLEHPAETKAWPAYDLPRPPRDGWAQAIGDAGWVTEVDQHVYGHPARKRTWLYYVGLEPPTLNWRRAPVGQTALVSWLGYGKRDPRDLEGRRLLTRREALATPDDFRHVLIAMARSARVASEAA